MLYLGYIAEQLEAQQGRKSSLEQRGISVITSSGALVTLLFALSTLSTKRAQTYSLPRASEVLAIVLALLTNMPRSYEGVTADALRKVVSEHWGDSEAAAARNVALTKIKVLQTAKSNNAAKARFLFAAVVAEVIALGFIGAAVGVVITS